LFLEAGNVQQRIWHCDMEVVYGGKCEANELKRRDNVSGKSYLKSRTRRSLPSLDPHNWVDLQHHSGDKMKLDGSPQA
jgi:hypothetical protein